MLRAWLLVLVTLTLLAWGCAAAEERPDEVAAGSGGKPSASQSSAGATGGSGGSGGMGGGLTPTECLDTCSDDGLHVTDCNGNVLSDCTGDDRCVNAKCVSNPCIGDDPTKTSMGCDFWAAQPTRRTVQEGCFALYLVNPWPAPAHIEVDFQGVALPVEEFTGIPSGQGKNTVFQPYDPQAGVPPGEVAVLFFYDFGLSQGCPYPAHQLPFAAPGGSFTGIDSAIHVRTDVPNVAYQILPYGGGDSAITSATLLLPTRTWGTDYLAVSSWGAWGSGVANPNLAVVASEDGTTVSMTPKVDIQGNDVVSPGAAGVVSQYTLDRGQVLVLNQAEELTGGLVQADKPIGVFGGHDCLQVPTDLWYCDGSHQQIPPIRALGTEYVGLRYRNRYPNVEETVPWRLVGAADGTVLTWEPSAPPGAPATLEAGQIWEMWTPGPFVVRSQDSQHPFYLGAYMTSCTKYGTDFDCHGDPEWVNVVPTDQYLDAYTFFTDPTYPETTLNLVRRPGPTGFFDVYLDCLGKVESWTDVGDYQVANIDLVTGNFEPVGNCSNGVHRVFSQGAFALTVWGWGSPATGADPDPDAFNTQCVSYAYPGGIGLAIINDVEVPPPPK